MIKKLFWFFRKVSPSRRVEYNAKQKILSTLLKFKMKVNFAAGSCIKSNVYVFKLFFPPCAYTLDARRVNAYRANYKPRDFVRASTSYIWKSCYSFSCDREPRLPPRGHDLRFRETRRPPTTPNFNISLGNHNEIGSTRSKRERVFPWMPINSCRPTS